MNVIGIILTTVVIIGLIMTAIAIIKKPSSIYKNLPEEQNLLEGKMVVFVDNQQESKNADGVRGHLEIKGRIIPVDSGVYEKYVKRALDVLLSFIGLLVISPLLLVLIALIRFSDRGSAFFIQKRVGKNKQFFKIHKLRTMKKTAPYDVPTHMMEDVEKYTTKIGRLVRKSSMDELPQLWDVFIGNMSLVGPRPALWNQDFLTAERDKYGANDIKPGLTGWAQINGRDAITISEKAKLDGEYTKVLIKGGVKAFIFDVRCLLGTLFHR